MDNKVNQVRIGAVLSYINMAIGTLIPMFYTPLMLNLLGQDEYGLFKLATSVTSYLALISFGLGSAVVRYYTKYRAEGDRVGEENVFGLFTIIYGIISLVTLIVGIVLVFLIGNIYGDSLAGVSSVTGISKIVEMRILILVLAFTAALNFLSTPYMSVVSSHERFLFVQGINILLTVITPVVNIIALVMGFASIGMVVSSLIIQVVVQILYLSYVKLSIKLKPRFNNLKNMRFLLKDILSFSVWIFIMNLIDQLYNSTDVLIIGGIPKLATTGVAIYSVGITFNTMIRSFSTGLSTVLTPKTNMMVFGKATSDDIDNLLIRVGRMQCIIVSLVATGFITFGQSFIKLWVGDGYDEAYWITIVTTIPVCIPLVQNIALNVIVAQNKLKFRTVVFGIITVANIIGTVICVNQYGIIGAAVVTGIAYLIGPGIILNIYYWKKIGINIPLFWKKVGPMFIMPTILCVFTLFVQNYIVLDNWFKMLTAIIIYAIVFMVFSWLFVMNKYEKSILLSPINMIKNKIHK